MIDIEQEINRFMPIVYREANRRSQPSDSDYDDYVQTGRLVILECIAQGGVDFRRNDRQRGGYYRAAIRRRMNDLMAETTREDHVSLNSSGLVDPPKCDQPESLTQAPAEDYTDLAHAVGCLSAEEREMIQMSFGFSPFERTYTDSEIARYHNVTRSCVSVRKMRAMRKLRKVLELQPIARKPVNRGYSAWQQYQILNTLLA